MTRLLKKTSTKDHTQHDHVHKETTTGGRPGSAGGLGEGSGRPQGDGNARCLHYRGVFTTT